MMAPFMRIGPELPMRRAAARRAPLPVAKARARVPDTAQLRS